MQHIILGYFFYKEIAIKAYLIWAELDYNWSPYEWEFKIILYCRRTTIHY